MSPFSKRVAALSLASLCAVNTAAAGGYNPRGGVASPGMTIAIPLAEVDSAANLSYGMIGIQGLSGNVDLFVGGFANAPIGVAGDAPAFGVAKAAVRWFPVDQLGIQVGTKWGPGMDAPLAYAGLHSAQSWGRFSMTTNLDWNPTFNDDGQFTAGSATLLLAPQVNVGGGVSVFCEVDPGLDLTTADPSLKFVPGAAVNLDPAGNHSLAVGVTLAVVPDVDVSSGLWYARVWDGKRARARRAARRADEATASATETASLSDDAAALDAADAR